VAEIDGRQLLPIDVQLALDDLGAPEFQMTPGAGASLRLRVESDKSSATIAGELSERLGVPVDVELVSAGTLPRATFKARRAS
jgi:phenylacetate-CoA ligase